MCLNSTILLFERGRNENSAADAFEKKKKNIRYHRIILKYLNEEFVIK